MSDTKVKQPKSMKTTVAGYLGGVLLILGELADLMGMSAEGLVTNGNFELATLMAGAAMLGLGHFSRDHSAGVEAPKEPVNIDADAPSE